MSAANPTGDPRVQKLSQQQIQKLIDAPKTPRVREVEYLQAVFEGTQYTGRPNFFTDDQPMQERAPCVIYKLAAAGIESNVAFAMGESRFPVVLSLSSENDKAFDDDLGLSPKDSEVVDSFNAKLLDLARLEQVFRNAYRMAQASRSVAVVLGFRSGLPFADLIWSKLCTPTFGDPNDPCRVTKLEIRYRYTQQWRDPVLTGGEYWTRVLEYLRVIDGKADTIYRPVPIWDVNDAGAIEGQSTIQAQTLHGFGLCPVHWYGRNRESLVGDNFDGRALHDGVCPLLEQMDLALSQRHRAAVYAGDPQTVLIGVSPDEAVAGGGRNAMPAIPEADRDANGNPKGQWAGAMYGGQGGGTALKRGVGQLWRIQASDGKAMMLTLSGDALDALDKDAQDLVAKACDGLGIVLMDPSAFKGGGDLSGRTLAFIFSKQINRVSQDREDLGRCCILPVLNLFYRMLLAKPKGVYLPGLAKVLPILARFMRDVDGSNAKVWFCPQLKLKWGDYFEPSDVDEATRVANALNAYNGKLLTRTSAVEHIRGVFAIGSVDQYVKQLEKDDVDRLAAAPVVTPPSSPNAAPPASPQPKAKRDAPVA